MKRILFVDDDRCVLDGLRRMLRPLRHEWELAFATSGAEALALLERERFDVIVSDMRMPEMDGTELLTEVMRRHPHMVRMALSGHAQKEMALRAVRATHQYLAKPCDAETLRNAITRACQLRDLLADQRLRQLVSQVESLPSLPKLYLELVEEIEKPNASVRRVGQLIARDLGMTAKVLQLVNSAFFGLRRHVSDPAQAASLLGLDTIKALVLTVQVFAKYRHLSDAAAWLERLWNHSAAVGAAARRIASTGRDPVLADHALLAGLVHDVGKLILMDGLAQRYLRVVDQACRAGLPLWQTEQETFGCTHAEVGAYLFGLWGLPDPIVEAVAHHHQPQRCPDNRFSALTAVHLADCCEHQSQDGGPAGQPDVAYLNRLGLTDNLEAWREICAGTFEMETSR